MIFENIQKSKLAGCPFVFRFGSADTSSLGESIKKWGLLHPVLVWKKEDNFFLLDGALRRDCFPSEKIPAQIIETNDDAHAFMLGLEANQLSREFNLIEKAFLLQQASTLGCLDVVLQKLEIKSYQQKEYQQLLSLPDAIRSAVVTLNWPLHIATRWLDIPTEERQELFDATAHLPFNQNKWGEILIWLSDIAKRDRVSPMAIVREIFSIDKQADLITPDRSIFEGDLQQKAQFLREEIEKRRFTRLKQKQKDFSSVIQKNRLPKGVQIEPSPFFESRDILLKAKITSLEDLEKMKESLSPHLVQQLLTVMDE